MTVMLNQPVKNLTSSGHYCVNIMDNEGKNIHGNDHFVIAAEDVTLKKQRNEDVESQCDEVLTISEKINSADEHKILIKLHRLFAHDSLISDKLRQ